MKYHGTTQCGNDFAWFCIRSQQKREHVAAANLKRLQNVEVFNPCIRVKKVTKRGPVAFVEPLFPNYVFARFPFQTKLEEVKYTYGVNHVLQFGGKYPVVPNEVIAELQAHFCEDALQLFKDLPEKGDVVTITNAAFYGLNAVVLRVLPAKQRVQVLIEMLGQATAVEVSLDAVVAERQPMPRRLLATA